MTRQKILVDSNILIYSYQPEYDWLKLEIIKYHLHASAISKVETFGYHNLAANDNIVLSQLFNLIKILPIEERIIDKAITLKQQKKMSLGDSIIASTALLNNLPLMTRNVADFAWINGISLINPFED